MTNDLISRQAAIKAICEDGTWLESQGCTDISMAERKQRDADILSDLPSAQPDLARDIATIIENEKDMRVVLKNAQPEPQWIPCSERLPEEEKEVLISSDSGIYIAELEIYDGNAYWTETIEYRSVKNVYAWMPLPEPYKGERNDREWD